MKKNFPARDMPKPEDEQPLVGYYLFSASIHNIRKTFVAEVIGSHLDDKRDGLLIKGKSEDLEDWENFIDGYKLIWCIYVIRKAYPLEIELC